MLKYMCKLFMVSIYCGSVNSNFCRTGGGRVFRKSGSRTGRRWFCWGWMNDIHAGGKATNKKRGKKE